MSLSSYPLRCLRARRVSATSTTCPSDRRFEQDRKAELEKVKSSRVLLFLTGKCEIPTGGSVFPTGKCEILTSRSLLPIGKCEIPTSTLPACSASKKVCNILPVSSVISIGPPSAGSFPQFQM